MTRCYMTPVYSFVLASMFVTVQAGVVPGHWEMVETLQHEAPVVVVLRSGERLEGRLGSLEPEALLLAVEGGKTTPIPKESIQQITLVRQVEDKPWNGAAIGALCGVAAFVAIHALAYPEEPAPTHAQDGILFPLAGGGGFAIGYMLDKSRKGSAIEERTVYQAVP